MGGQQCNRPYPDLPPTNNFKAEQSGASPLTRVAKSGSGTHRLQLGLPLGRALLLLLLGRLVGAHAGLRNRFEEALDLGVAVGEGEGPEAVARVLDELDEGDEQAPGVRPVHYQPLQQHARYLLLHNLLRSSHATHHAFVPSRQVLLIHMYE